MKTFFLICISIMMLAGCGVATKTEPASETLSAITLHFLAASSTVNVAEELAAKFEQEHGIKVKVITGPTNALAQQILSGAPADLFLAASPKWVEPLTEQQLVAETKPLLGNRLVIAVPVGNPAGLNSPADLRKDGVKQIALAGENVPAGIYAEETLHKFKLYDELLAAEKIVRGHDVRVTLNYIERGEVEAGIVYATDVIGSTHAEAVYTFPDDVSPTIVLPVTLLKNSRHPEEAKQFYDELGSPASREMYKRHGFTPLD
ncbi:MAG: molybdate ABC transporter substrate-binding protein [Planctomycetaceae bacterium]